MKALYKETIPYLSYFLYQNISPKSLSVVFTFHSDFILFIKDFSKTINVFSVLQFTLFYCIFYGIWTECFFSRLELFLVTLTLGDEFELIYPSRLTVLTEENKKAEL